MMHRHRRIRELLWHLHMKLKRIFNSASKLSNVNIQKDIQYCEDTTNMHHLKPAPYIASSRHGWYWGGITSSEAEELLAGQHDNVFLVRDSCDSRHILCVSFRCVGRTLHARLRHANGLFSLNNETFVPANRISEHCAAVDVKSNLFEMPVKLARPLNRFAKLDSLQMICRFVIRQTVSAHVWSKLPLPPNLISYVSIGSDYIVPS
ncbi:unnamed protein product [Chrysodeixis includens]|uniref:Suppressor of cytokine signaling 6 n=1 Tax=Chrysodeixis includens TaxID=689277 RepID=A0A9N8KX99_CHRIL|nr:unnamed protein product [Chrysodeixis includens]